MPFRGVPTRMSFASAYPSALNTVTITSNAVNRDPSNNTATDEVTIGTNPTLAGSQTVQSRSGNTVVWRISVANEGPGNTTEPITVVDTLPAQLSYVSASGTGWQCSASGQTLTCKYAEVLEEGQTTFFDLTSTLSDTNATVVNTAAITGGTTGGAEVDVTGESEGSNTPGPTGSQAIGFLTLGLTVLLLGLIFRIAARRREMS